MVGRIVTYDFRITLSVRPRQYSVAFTVSGSLRWQFSCMYAISDVYRRLGIEEGNVGT